jgi:chromosome segregation ATPase
MPPVPSHPQAAHVLGELEAQLSNVQVEINEATVRNAARVQELLCSTSLLPAALLIPPSLLPFPVVPFLQTRENELTEDVHQLQRDNAALVTPALAALTRSITEMKEEASQAASATASLEETKAELRRRMERLTHDIKTLTASCSNLRVEENKASVEPARLAKQMENVDRALEAVGAEVERLQGALGARNKDIGAQTAAVADVNEVRATLERKLASHRAEIDGRDQEVISLERTLRAEKARHKELLERKVEVGGDEERARSAVRGVQSELDAVNQAYERVKRELKHKLERLSQTTAAEGPAHSLVIEKEQDRARLADEAKRLEAAAAVVKKEMDGLIAQYLREEAVEKKHRSALAEVAEACASLETERDHWHDEEDLAYKQIAALKMQAEMKAREVEKTVAARKATIEASRMKELALSDLSKQLADVNSQLKQFSSLYEAVKSERNSYAQAIQAAQQSTGEMRERLKILRNEVDILHNECSAKDKALNKEQHAFATASSQRDALRAAVNTAAKEYTERQQRVQQQILSIDKLSGMIDGLNRDMNVAKRQYEAAVEMRNYTAVQLIDRNDELVVLYEKSNVHEKTVAQGEMSMQSLNDEMRGLQIALQELERQLHVSRYDGGEGRVGRRGGHLCPFFWHVRAHKLSLSPLLSAILTRSPLHPLPLSHPPPLCRSRASSCPTRPCGPSASSSCRTHSLRRGRSRPSSRRASRRPGRRTGGLPCRATIRTSSS